MREITAKSCPLHIKITNYHIVIISISNASRMILAHIKSKAMVAPTIL